MWSRSVWRIGAWALMLICGWLASAGTAAGAAFTREELDWIKANPVVTYVGDSHAFPFEYSRHDQYKGLPADYLRRVAEISGLEFRFVPTESWEAAQRAFLDHKADLFPSISPSRVSKEVASQLTFSQPYYSATTVIVTRADASVILDPAELQGKVVAMRKDGLHASAIAKLPADIKPLFLEEPHDVLEALMEGKADAALGPDAAALPLIRRRYPGKLSISGVYASLPYVTQMATRSDLPLLHSIISKSLGSMSAVETDVINERWFKQADFGQPTWTAIAKYQLRELALLICSVALLGWFAYRAHTARSAAQASEQAKSRFLAMMSHEIRTPLNAILGNLELLEHSELKPSQASRLKIIRTSSNGLLAIISDILDLSKVEAGQLSLEHIDFDLIDVAEHALMMFAPTAHKKDLALYGTFHTSSVQMMRGDPARLSQILNNLLSNAIKFTSQGKVTLRIVLELGTTGEQWVDLTVEDTGIGMTSAQQRSIFKAFAQADTSINRRFGGTGLGLTLSQLLAKAMGGSISVISKAGEGSRFTVRLPIGVTHERGDDLARFSGQEVAFIAPTEEWHSFVVPHLRKWGLRVRAHRHPGQIDDAALEEASALIIYRDHANWNSSDENRLIEQAHWVIDCQNDGPARPVRTGRIFSVSCFTLRGVHMSLCQALQVPSWNEQLSWIESTVSGTPFTVNRLPALRVLVAEDNPVNQQLFAEQLALLGCDARVVEGGSAALAALRETAWDALLTDLNMPGMSGYELAAAAHALQPTLPIVAVTAHATPEEQHLCEKAGMQRVLTKPLFLDSLYTVLLAVSKAKNASFTPPQHGSSSVMGGAPVPAHLRDIFVDSCTKALDVIRIARSHQDAAALRAELHSLSGALNVFGHKQLADLCVQIGQRLHREGIAELASQLDHLEEGLQPLLKS